MEAGKSKLESLGIPPITPGETPEAYAEFFRAARKLRTLGLKTIALIPSDDRVAIPPVAIQLALALSHAAEQTVNVLDANTRHPALSGLASKLEERTQRRGFVTTWIADRVTVTTPPSRLAGLNLVELEETLDRDRQRYGCVLIDFTGFEKLGEHVRAYQIVDGVLIVARTGKTKERDLLARHAEVPDEKALGVLLIG
ncbi:MAG: hypothetical protein H6718_18425 [Polyangiaceae bacterium]|nr:hypothetical protein [Polyangiaceae bacterium]MCB9605820.1 hypothetical protein [Polyangiaceae bacterium]